MKIITAILKSLLVTFVGYSCFGFILNRLLPPYYHYHIVMPSFIWIPRLIGKNYSDNVEFTAILLLLLLGGTFISFFLFFFLCGRKKQKHALLLLGAFLLFYLSFCASYFFAFWIPGA